MIRVLIAFQKMFARLYVTVGILLVCGEYNCMTVSFLEEGRIMPIKLA